MDYIYLDNFRGFQNTTIPLVDVNFLVGENSTGKSSVLSLINLISDRKFLESADFGSGESGFATFDDIKSSNSVEDSFSIGAYGPTRQGEWTAFLMRFKSEDGLPKISELSMFVDYDEVEIRVTKREIRYRYRAHGENTEEEIRSSFLDWVDYTEIEENYNRIAKEIITDNVIWEILYSVSTDIRDRQSKLIRSTLRRLPLLDRIVNWVAPIRSKPRLVYGEFSTRRSPEGDHAPYVISKILSKKSSRRKFERFMLAFGKESGLFERIDISRYGSSPHAPFMINVDLGGRMHNVTNVGYGVSQVLPLLVDFFNDSPAASYAIQQPEVHLHPRAQAALGGLVFKLAREKKSRFYIETHSEFMIDRFRLSQSKRKINVDAQVLFFTRNRVGNRVFPVEIQGDGGYSDLQPKKFKDFFIREELGLLGLQ